MALEKWEYKTCGCRHVITKKTLLGVPTEAHWILILDGIEQELSEALEDLGKKGWELAGIQSAGQSHDGMMHAASIQPSIYVFKRSMGEF